MHFVTLRCEILTLKTSDSFFRSFCFLRQNEALSATEQNQTYKNSLFLETSMQFSNRIKCDVGANKMPVRHFLCRDYLHILFYIKFLVFVSLVHQIMKYRFHLLKCAKLCIPQFTKFLFRPVNIRTKMFFFMAVTSDRDNCAAKFPVKF